MTVAAVVVPESIEEALADTAGRIGVRRIVDSAWAGGALPIVVVAVDDGAISAALDGSPAVLVDPGSATGVSAFRLGVARAHDVVMETSAIMLWPGRMTWADPETVTSLIEAHGRAADRILRPHRAGEPGWPILVPSALVADLLRPTETALEEVIAAAATTSVELGDPGSVLGREVALDDLPDYAGPPEPVGGPPPEWGAAAAETPDPEVVDPDRPRD